MQADRDATQIEEALLMLSQTILGFIGRRNESLLDLPGFHFCNGRNVERLAALLRLGQQGLSITRQKADSTGCRIDYGGDYTGRETDGALFRLNLKVVSPACLGNNRQLGRWKFRCRADDYMYHPVSAHLDAHHPAGGLESDPICIRMGAFDRKLRMTSGPLC